MPITKLGLGGPVASFSQGGGEPGAPPAPSGGSDFLLLGVRLLLVALLPFLA